MFWKKSKSSPQSGAVNSRYPYRFCHLYISSKFKEILFVPFGKAEAGFHVELDNIDADTWPCNFEQLQINIEAALNKYQPIATYTKGNWPSYNKSKAKSQQSFEFDYIRISVATDLTKGYGALEAERINISAQPTSIDAYSLEGCRHLLDTQVAQMVIDIFEGCSKIRY